MGADDPDLHGLLDNPDGEPPPGADELRAIVGRVPRRRWGWGMVGVAAACTLAVGLGVGYAVSNHSSSPRDVVATGPGTTTGGAVAPSPAIAGGQGQGAPSANSSGSANGTNGATPSIGFVPDRYTYLFSRTAGDITVRGYRLDSSLPGGSPAGCGVFGPQFQAEVSTPKMVGTVETIAATPSRTQPLSAARAEVIGTAEGDPTVVALAATGSGVTEVRATFTGGRTDSMKPVNGWVALVAPTAAPASSSALSPESLGTLTAVDSAGRALATQRLTFAVVPGPIRPLPQVQPPVTLAPGREVPGAVAPATPSSGAGASTGSAGASSGSAGASSGSAGASSGSAGASSGSSGSAGASSGAVSGGNIASPCTGVVPEPAGAGAGGPAR